MNHPQTIKDAIDCIRTLALHINSYGVVTSEEQARSIIKTHADLVSCVTFIAFGYLSVMNEVHSLQGHMTYKMFCCGVIF